VLEQIDMNDLKSILDNHKQELKKEIEEILLNSSQCPVLVPRNKLIEMLDCSASWLSKVTTSGEMPSIVIGGRVFYDLKEIAKKDIFTEFKSKSKGVKK
jgi:hypothetical protein